MKKTVTILAALLLTACIFAQAPQLMSYQAVIRNSSNKLVVSTSVGMRISILQGSATGTAVYVETQTPTTNINGLASLEIGSGTIVSGSFSNIDWSAGQYFIKTETDPTGGTAYSITGASQLLSVPYAFYSANGNPVHYIGESYGGGIVFYVYDNGHHGLIAATTDQNTGMRWYAGTNSNTMAMADGVGAGKANTAIIIAKQGYGDGSTYAARVCNEYTVKVGGVTYGDWYLPSKYELNLLYLQKSAVGGFGSNYYWSSTEIDEGDAWSEYFMNGLQFVGEKFGQSVHIRAVRAF
jgi:hypothetical protein